jgi:hypothetical protein
VTPSYKPFDVDDHVWGCTADIAWIAGYSYSVYAPLLSGTSSLIYEGAPDYPEPDALRRLRGPHLRTLSWRLSDGYFVKDRLSFTPKHTSARALVAPPTAETENVFQFRAQVYAP